MAHDLIIRGGAVLDGSGSEATAADVAVDGDRITAIGDLAGAESAREIDATGLTVSPGFVDLHTHFDAQIGWDPLHDLQLVARRDHGPGRQLRDVVRPGRPRRARPTWPR